MSPARYRLISADGGELEVGQADVTVSPGAFVLAPESGNVLRVPYGQIRSVSEPEPFAIRVGLTDGTSVDLTGLGVMRTQILAELADRRGESAAGETGAIGQAEVFAAERRGVPVDLRLHDDVLLIVGPDGIERVSFSFIRSVETVSYAVRIDAAGQPLISLSRLGRRTDEFAGLLSDRIRAASGRTSAFLESLLPGLSAMELRGAAGKLRDGVAVPSAELDAIHPELSASLIRFAALPARRAAAAEIGRRGELAIGFKQLASIRREASGTSEWRDHSAAPHIDGHAGQGGYFAPGPAGMLAAGVMAGGPRLAGPGWGGGPMGGGLGGFSWDGPDGWDSGYWAFRALGAGMSRPDRRPRAARPNVTRGRLTPATEDLGALVATGADPTVMAFVLGVLPGAGDAVVFEVLNLPGPPTFVYRAGRLADADRAVGPEATAGHDAATGRGALALINRALDGVGFRADEARPAALDSRRHRGGDFALLAKALTARIEHDTDWPARLAQALGERR